MKNTTSFHLEESTLDFIKQYQYDNRLSSRNIALEHILVEYKTMKEFGIDKIDSLNTNNSSKNTMSSKGKRFEKIMNDMED